MIKYKVKSISACAVIALVLAGCGAAKVPEVVDVTSIAISEEGIVTSYLVDKFDKDYYSLSDLNTMAIEEAAEYNSEKQVGENVPLTVEKVEALEDGSDKVVVTHNYDSTDTFMDYN